MIDFEVQRKNMVESQVRPSDITDRRIIRAMLDIPREAFAPEDTRALAYMDQDLPVGPSSGGRQRRALLAPRVLAMLLQHLQLDQADRAMTVGSATGYSAAVLARIVASVVALDCDPRLSQQAASVLFEQGISNIRVVSGALAEGWPVEAPYSAILVAGAVPEIPPTLLDQLQDGGRLTAVTLVDGVSRVVLWQRFKSSFASRTLAEAGARMLPGFERSAGFTF